MSPRRWLDRWPLCLRIFVLVLAVLQVVAPSWHVCGLSGHAGNCSTPSHEMAAPTGPMQPVICFCREEMSAEERYARDWATKTNGVPGGFQPDFCLALLLQTMPGQAAVVAPPIAVPGEIAAPLPCPTQESAVVRPRNLIPGRGPPLSL